MDAEANGEHTPIALDQISTHWTQLQDPVQILMRYGPAIRLYLETLLKRTDEADEVAQTFLLAVLERGFPEADPSRGRFRDYLKACVRNAAMDFLRRKRGQHQAEIEWRHVADPGDEDQRWLSQWRACLLERVWSALEHHQQKSPGNLGYTVLRLVAEHPKDDSRRLSERVGAETGTTLRPEAFRKQVSRARRKFAELLVEEIKKTLDNPGAEQVREELAELGLTVYMKDYLQE